MKTTARRQKEKKHRREQILNAAEQLIFEKGPDAVRMDDVAEAAELSKGTLYLYFQNKTELALAIHVRGVKILINDVARELSKSGTGLDLIRRMAGCFFEFANTHPHYFNLVIYFEAAGPEVIREVNETETMKESNRLGDELYHYLVRAVQVGIQDGSIDPALNPHLVGLHIMGSVRGLIQVSRFQEEGFFMDSEMMKVKINLRELLDSFMEMMIRALRPQKTD